MDKSGTVQHSTNINSMRWLVRWSHLQRALLAHQLTVALDLVIGDAFVDEVVSRLVVG